MINIVTEFEVKDEARGEFELAYGPGGAWSRLFATCAGFRGITLLRDTEKPQRYLTIETWDTQAQRERILPDRQADYASIQARLADWTEGRTELGTFRVLAEAAVRPAVRGRGNKARGARRKGR